MSTKTPWIVSWPGRVRPGSVEATHLVSGIGYMATMLAAAGIEALGGINGFSFLPLLAGEQQQGRKYVFAEFHQTFAKRQHPMRCAQDARFGYIYNAWAGKTPPMRMDSTNGLTCQAMKKAAAGEQGT